MSYRFHIATGSSTLPLRGAFVAVTGSASQHGGVTDASGQIIFAGVEDGAYTVTVSAPGTTVSTLALAVPVTISATVTVTDSGGRFRGLGAYGSQTGTILPDGQSGVFYLNTTAIPSLWRTANYGGRWAPVTMINDDATYGIDNMQSVGSIATSGFPGEIAGVVLGKVYYSRDYGVTWSNLDLPAGFTSFPLLLWGHVGETSALFLHLNPASSDSRMAYANMPTFSRVTTPTAFTILGAVDSFKTTPADVLYMARGEAAPILAAAPDGTGSPITLTLYEISGTAFSRTAAAGAIVTGVASVTMPTFIRLGGPHTGPVVGTARAPNTLLVYTDDPAAANKSARMSTYIGGAWRTTSATQFTFFDSDDIDPSGTFGACGAQPGAIGGIPAGGAPLGSVGSVAQCWVTQAGITLTVRPDRGINNNTGLAFDAAYGLTATIGTKVTTNTVVLSGDGSMGLIKSARFVQPGDGTGLNRPYFPPWPKIANGGFAPDSGGIAVTGLEAAVIRDVAFGRTANDLVAVMAGGGRVIGTNDGGATWATLQPSGGEAIDWWPRGAGEGWLLKGGGSDGSLLAGMLVTGSFTFTSQLAPIAGTSGTDLEGTYVSAIVGAPGTNSAFVGLTRGPNNAITGGTLRKVTLGGSPGALTVTLGPTLTEVTTSVVALDYCPSSISSTAVLTAPDTLFVAMQSYDASGLIGALAVYTNASVTPTLVSLTSGNFRDVRAQCTSGIIYAARYAPSGGSPSSGMLKSSDGGLTWNPLPIILADPDLAGRFRNVETFAVNPDNPNELVLVSSEGDVISTRDGGLTWTIQNDTRRRDARHFGGERPGDIEIWSGTVFGPTRHADRSAAGALADPANAVFGSGAGLFSARVRSDSPVTPRAYLPLVAKAH